jgi:DUF971 family protein
MDVRPVGLELKDNTLRITWSDGQARQISVGELRNACPCATCREKRNAPPAPSLSLPVLSLAEARPLTVQRMQPVGNYAYSIEFSDGHGTGIYTLEFLRELGQPAGGS